MASTAASLDTTLFDRAKQQLMAQGESSPLVATFLSKARGDHGSAAALGEPSPLLMDESVLSGSGTNSIGAAPMRNTSTQLRFAGEAIAGKAEMIQANLQAAAAEKAAAARSRGSAIGSALGALGSLGGAAIIAMCDERLKEDLAPLESAEAGDLLGELAWAVKELRERP